MVALLLMIGCLIDSDLYNQRMAELTDADNDGVTVGDADCDDSDPTVAPGLDEVCDGVDNDCDGQIDEDAVDASTWYVDGDRDGFGQDDEWTTGCEQPQGTAETPGDCDDLDDLVNPDADELCNDGVDNDCDGTDNGCAWQGDQTTDDADHFVLGAAPSDGIGVAMVAADLDGDGYGDVVTGALHGNAAYVVSGRGMATVTYLAANEGAMTRGAGLSDAYILAQGVGACDVDGDGWTDALVSGLEYGSASDLWVFDGPITDDRTTDDAMLGIRAEGNTDFLGNSIACGDVNGDTAVDLIVGAGLHDGLAGSQSGAAYTVFGPLALSGSASITAIADEIEGDAAGIHLGAYVAAGDIDGDGLADRVIGATEDGTGAVNAGAVYAFVDNNSATLLEDADVALIGEEAGGRFGVVAVGDLDGDGRGEVVVGADFVDIAAEDAGAVWVFAASERWPDIMTTGSDASAQILGVTPGDRMGIGTAVLQDINRDGRNELLVDAGFADAEAADGGVAYIFDRLDPDAGSVSPDSAQLSIAGTNPGALAGYTASGVADLDRDGQMDLVLGAHGDDTSGADSGGLFVFLGRGL